MEFTDTAVVANSRLTKDGFLVVNANVARANNIQIYKGSEMGRPEMAAVRVYRPEEEVFSKDALASFTHKAVTNNHPVHMVDASSWKSVAVGMTGDTVLRDGDHVRVPFTLMDANTVKLVKDGKRQLSAGYTATIDWTSGQTETGEVFDAVQREIRGNHLAIVDAARAGPSCQITDSWNTAAPVRDESTTSLTTKEFASMAEVSLKAIVLDGFTIQVNDQGAQAIDKLQRQIADMTTVMTQKDGSLSAIRDAHASELSSLKAEHQKVLDGKSGEIAALASQHAGMVDALKAENQKALDALTGEVAALKSAQPTAAQMDALIAARSSVIDAARKILGDKFDHAGKPDAQIRREAVTKRLGAASVSDKSDEYVTAAFDTLTAVGAGAPPGRDPVRDHFVNTPAPRHQSQDMNDADAAHDKYVADMRNAWKSKAKESV